MANRRLVIFLPPMLTFPSCSSRASDMIRSRKMLKRVADRRHLCLTPTVVLNHSPMLQPVRVAQSVGHLTRKSGVLVRYPVWPHTLVSPSADSRGAVVIYWRKFVHEVLVNCLGGLSLPKKSLVWLTGRPVDVYCGRKTTIQQQQQPMLPFNWTALVALS